MYFTSSHCRKLHYLISTIIKTEKMAQVNNSKWHEHHKDFNCGKETEDQNVTDVRNMNIFKQIVEKIKYRDVGVNPSEIKREIKVQKNTQSPRFVRLVESSLIFYLL